MLLLEELVGFYQAYYNDVWSNNKHNESLLSSPNLPHNTAF
jgi:hypothetical protein